MGTAKCLAIVAALSSVAPARVDAAADATTSGPVDLALKRVALSTGGVAYMEMEATVVGDGEMSLDVPLDQVDDVLKSVVVYDPSGGPATVRLAGLDAQDRAFAGLPFGPDALGSPDTLLNALRGAVVTTGDGVTGRVLGSTAETARDGRGEAVTRHRVSLLAADGIRQFVLEDARSVAFADPEVRTQVDRALAAVAGRRERDCRRVTIAVRGRGTREVRVGYVVGAPLWKATYRLTLPYADGPRAHVQGWAVLENTTGRDWKDVELTLLSGDPVSFRQAIYRSYYVPRPQVPVEVEGHVLPEPDRGAVAAKAFVPTRVNAAPPEGDPDPPRRPYKAATPTDASPRAPSALADVASAQEGATQARFRIPAPVSVRDGQSAMVPIVDEGLPVDRVDLYAREADGDRPLASVRLRNDTATGLPPGVLTVYDEARDGISYVGDARLADLPAGEVRLLGFAVDERTKVVRTEGLAVRATGASVADGTLKIRRAETRTTTYRIAAPAAEARRVVVETPKAAGWDVARPDVGVEETASAYRSTVDLKAGETRTLSVVMERVTLQASRVVDWDGAEASASAVSGSLPPKVAAALGRVAELRGDLARARAERSRVARARDDMADEQARVRLDLAQVDKGDDLRRRYVDKLAAQEDAFDAYRTLAEAATEAVAKAEAALDAYVRGLDL